MTGRAQNGRRRAPGLRLLAAVCVPAAVVALAAGCGDRVSSAPVPEVPGGNPVRGQELVSSYGCGSCHTVSGVRGADGLVGPPLTGIGQRAYIAGELPTTGENLQRWIMNPQEVEPGVAMPDLGVTAKDARDIAAFLVQDR
jgi:cytochrome c2